MQLQQAGPNHPLHGQSRIVTKYVAFITLAAAGMHLVAHWLRCLLCCDAACNTVLSLAACDQGGRVHGRARMQQQREGTAVRHTQTILSGIARPSLVLCS
jgi:hypothetical protein